MEHGSHHACRLLKVLHDVGQFPGVLSIGRLYKAAGNGHLLGGVSTFSHSADCCCWGRYGPCDRAELRERMKRVVALLGEDEVNRILEQEGKIEVCVLLTICFHARCMVMLDFLDLPLSVC